jgi:hypothetical protein
MLAGPATGHLHYRFATPGLFDVMAAMRLNVGWEDYGAAAKPPRRVQQSRHGRPAQEYSRTQT